MKQLTIHFSRLCILPCCVVRRLNSPLFALLTPCRTGGLGVPQKLLKWIGNYFTTPKSGIATYNSSLLTRQVRRRKLINTPTLVTRRLSSKAREGRMASHSTDEQRGCNAGAMRVQRGCNAVGRGAWADWASPLELGCLSVYGALALFVGRCHSTLITIAPAR